MLSHKSVFLHLKTRKNNYDKWNIANNTIDYVTNITYEIFFTDYLCLNKPCIIMLKDIDTWRSRKEWVSSGKPNFDFLKQFGSSVVPVADCNAREYNSQKKQSMLLKDYVDYWQNLESTNLQSLYLKDWHFRKEYPNYEAYRTPEYFKSDWLNEFCEKLSDDDYQFVYMGPKGTWTPLHADVFGSYSWSVNICGRKKWLLFPPGYENLLKDQRKELPYMVDENYLVEHDIFHLKVIQEAGEIIFVPSGWYHQVWNLEDTISINHNWFNGCNIEYIWKCLYQASAEVEKEITDIKDFDGWEDQWQIILKAHHGMNYSDFLQLLHFIFKSRVDAIESPEHMDINWHFIFDVVSVRNVCTKMKDVNIPESFLTDIENLLSKINSFLSHIADIRNIDVNF